MEQAATIRYIVSQENCSEDNDNALWSDFYALKQNPVHDYNTILVISPFIYYVNLIVTDASQRAIMYTILYR